MWKWIIMCVLCASLQVQGTELVSSVSLEYPKVALALYRLETGNGKSVLCRKYNNMFGFKASANTYHIARTSANYCIYSSKMQSLADYQRFEKRLIKKGCITEKKFMHYIFRRYAADKQFKQKFLKIYRTC